MVYHILAVFCLGILSLCPNPLWAKSMVITDRIEVGLRSGTGIEQQIVTMVKTGDQVEVLEGDKNWSKVRLADKTVGWIATRFLVDSIKPANSADPKMQEELQGLKEKNQNLFREKELLNREKGKLIEEVRKLTQSLQQEKTTQPSPELDELRTKNEKLDKEVALYKKQVVDLSSKGKGQSGEDNIKWFFAGSVVLCFGLLLGWLFSRIRRKPNRYY
ncbi:MAG: TIGR04211 family SH3 domain-containing protein [Pseudomonadota bacterium]